MLNKFLKDNKANFYLVFRLLVGLMFLFHGLEKFGIIGGGSGFELFTLIGLAAIIETLVGLAITVGAYTEEAAVLGGLTMIVAIILKHLPTSIIFTNNGAELALLYLAAFLVLATMGPGTKWVAKK